MAQNPTRDNGPIKAVIAQVNPVVGAFDYNFGKIRSAIRFAEAEKADILILPELVLTGYPPEDLLFKPDFIKASNRYLEKIRFLSQKTRIIVGAPYKKNCAIYNAAHCFYKKKREWLYLKHALPNYSVFDEHRYFKRGSEIVIFYVKGKRCAITICEDIWDMENGPLARVLLLGVDAIINISSSPYHQGKLRERHALLKDISKAHNVAIVYANLVGGQDELVFDGGSIVFEKGGVLVEQLPQFKEEMRAVAFCAHNKPRVKPIAKAGIEEETFNALSLGLKDYVVKNGFKKVVIGLSGGIDSAVCAAISSLAIGKENVIGVSMPSRYNSTATRKDAQRLAERLGIEFLEVPIDHLFEMYLNILSSVFKGARRDETEENIQARIRGNILMALSNKFGWLVVSTGNKSELSVGYCTLYGDMVGGFALLKDVPKTFVYRLARFINRRYGRPIPVSIIKRPPSAELNYNQKDEDKLPSYDVLDRIIDGYIEEHKPFAELKDSFDKRTLKKVLNLIDNMEYKRRQAPIGVRITPMAFGKDWRMPITNRFRL